ncbi:MAG TPA: RDD family protein, partial [Rhodocyclaceae bacterium]|nr:RDD family protein [Rhodocyclaceae bacterium]
TALLGAGFLWALVDSERQFLHDRIAGTRIVLEPRR